MLSPRLLRAIEVCHKVACDKEVIEHDVLTIAAAQDISPVEIENALVAEGVHVVDYACPEFEAYRTSSQKESEGIRRAAKFSGLRG